MIRYRADDKRSPLLLARFCVAALALHAMVACRGSTEPQVARTASLVLVSPKAIRGVDLLSDVPDTLVFEARDADGTLIPYWLFNRESTTGWLRSVAAGRWSRSGFLNADSTGRIRVLWETSDAPVQVLEISTYLAGDSVQRLRFSFPIQGSATPLRADTLVSSGPYAICFLSVGRVGCVGHRACLSCGATATTDRAVRSPHWLQFSSVPRTLTGTVSGACALLADGSTACWDGLGPDGVARNDVVHPPFAEMRGSIGRTAAGAVWKGVFGSYLGGTYAFESRTWLQIPSDSTIVSLLDDSNSLLVCGLTASRAVMCSSGRRTTPVFPDPPFRVTPMQLLRANAEQSVVRALGGYTSAFYVDRFEVHDRIVVWTTDGVGLRYGNITAAAGELHGDATRDSTLRSADASARACVPNLDATCSGGPWRSVTESGRTGEAHPAPVEVGWRRSCGMREVMVCWYYVGGSGRLDGTTVGVDTVRVAP